MNRTRLAGAMFLLGTAVILPSTFAQTKLAPLFGSHMVLPRGVAVPLTGSDTPGTSLRLKLSWSDAVSETKADDRGHFAFMIEVPKSKGPHRLEIEGTSDIVLEDVLAGEVWLGSGQSNMEMPLGDFGGGYTGVVDWQKEVESADHPEIRIYTVTNATARLPLDRAGGEWKVCTPEAAKAFSATAYFFGREIHRSLGTPVGLVSSDWGGTPIESWMSGDALAAFPEFAPVLEKLATDENAKVDAHTPTALFNGMIAPLASFPFSGFLWYQGESNRGRARRYADLFPAMIRSWRGGFGVKDAPFYFVQIAPFRYGNDRGETAELRLAQSMTLAVENTGMVVTMDIGDPADIHPKNKQEVGRRLALMALKRRYGKADVIDSGPTFDRMVVEGATLRIHFKDAKGLTSGDAAPSGFTLAGADGRHVAAKAVIDGETIILSSAEVTAPKAARYAQGAADEPKLMNGAGLPAAPFRTDTDTWITAPK